MKANNTDWFRDAKWGVFVHYLHPVVPAEELEKQTVADAWNRRIDNFDVEILADQLESINAGYFFMTIGQNSGFFLSPNQTYDSIVGRRPGLCSRRDLIADLSDALAKRNIRLMAYLPANAPWGDIKAVEALDCIPTVHHNLWKRQAPRVRDEDDRMASFQKKWEAVIRKWSIRWKNKVHGWWIDGCFDADYMYKHPEEPNFKSLATALKSGNPESIVAFASGKTVPPVENISEYEDFTAGELNCALPVSFSQRPLTRWVNQAQYHILTFLGDYWSAGNPRFSPEFVREYTKLVNSFGGVITWEIPLDTDGSIISNFFKTLLEANI